MWTKFLRDLFINPIFRSKQRKANLNNLEVLVQYATFRNIFKYDYNEDLEGGDAYQMSEEKNLLPHGKTNLSKE